MLKYTHTAYIKAVQMKALVDDLFEYTKVRQTDRPLNIVSVDMGAMLEQLGASFELEAQKKGMVIHLDEPTKPLMIEADPELLARVFNNLLTNALKYGSDGKNIFINLTQISETEAEITIANDGAKIPTEALGQVFERFYRVEESRSRKTGGTGLGLAIAQGIIDLHHGSINVTSNDKLTSFVMRLPLKHPKEEK